MKMTHEELEALLVDYLYDELDTATRLRFEAALPGAPELMAEVEAHRRTREAMSSLEDVPVPQGLLDGVMAEAERRADLRMESEPSFMERIFAGLMQPAALTLGLFFVMAGTGYYMVAEKGLHTPEDESLAVGAPASEPVGKAVPSEAETPPELEEVAEDKPSDDLEEGRPGAGDDPAEPVVLGGEDKGRDATAVALPKADAPAKTLTELSRLKGGGEGQSDRTKSSASKLKKKRARARPAKQSAVAPGTVARLVTVDEKKAELADRAPATEVEQRAEFAQSQSSGGLAKRAKATSSTGSTAAGNRGQKQVYQARPMEQQAGRERKSVNVARNNPSGYSTRVASAPSAPKPAAQPARDSEDSLEEEASDSRAGRDYGQRVKDKKAKTEDKASKADKKVRSPWKDAEDEASRQKNARATAGVWLRAYERFKKSGRRDLARRALDRLAKVPGYARVAKDKRRALAKTDAGGGPKKVPAAAERSFSREAPSKAKSKATKKK